MSRPLTSYVYLSGEEASEFYELVLAGDVAVLTSDDGHIKIHVQLGHAEDPLVSEEQ